MSPARTETDIGGRRLSLSNLGKVLYPETGFTKGELVDYYERIAPVMLAHVADRPLTLRRFPDGVGGSSFFEKHAPSHRPEWVPTVTVPSVADRPGGRGSRRGASSAVEHVLVGEPAALVWAANLATIELHVPLWHVGGRTELPAPPDHLVFDLDPGPGTSVVECCRVAGWIAERLEAQLPGAQTFPKTSGSKGLQLYALPPRGLDWDEARDQAYDIALALERDHDELVVSNMRKELRQGRVLIDWSQNHPAKTTVAAYSLRARPGPTVSTPVTWKEVDRCERGGDPQALRFLAGDVLARVERQGDLLAPLATSPS